MKKYIALIFTTIFFVCSMPVQSQIIDAVDDHYYVRVNICPTLLYLRFNDNINLGVTKIVQLTNTLPNDNITIDSLGVQLFYCWTGSYLKQRTFNYVLFEDTSGTGIGVYDTANILIDFANIDSIYPGDYNNDGIVNNIDLLGLGYNYNNSGLYRYGGASSNYIDFYGQDWDSVQSFIGAPINSKYADFNGSGRADNIDIQTYYLNYSKRHKTPLPYLPTIGGPTLKMVNTSTSDTFEDGSTLSLNLILGDSLNSLNNILGLAFTLEYDSTCVSPNFGDTIVKVIYNSSNNFFITPTNFLTSNVEINQDKTIQSAVVASNRIGVSGNGPVGSIIVVLDDYIDGNIKGSGIYPIAFEIKDIIAIDRDGIRIPIQTLPLQLYHKKTNIGIADKTCNSIELYPNPAKDLININNTCSATTNVEIFNCIGQPVLKFNVEDGNHVFSLKNMNPGYYQMILKDAESTTYKKLIINN